MGSSPRLIVGDEPQSIAISIGIAGATGQASDDLLREADAAMYAAKTAGKGGHETYVPGLTAVRNTGPVGFGSGGRRCGGRAHAQPRRRRRMPAAAGVAIVVIEALPEAAREARRDGGRGPNGRPLPSPVRASRRRFDRRPGNPEGDGRERSVVGMGSGDHQTRPGGSARGPTDTVLMPAELRYLELIRVVVEVSLSRSACDTGCMRDLQLATDELAAVLIGAACRPAELELAVTDDATDAYVRVLVPTPPDAGCPQIDALTRLLLDTTVDSYVFDAEDDRLLGVLQRSLLRDESR